MVYVSVFDEYATLVEMGNWHYSNQAAYTILVKTVTVFISMDFSDR